MCLIACVDQFSIPIQRLSSHQPPLHFSGYSFSLAPSFDFADDSVQFSIFPLFIWRNDVQYSVLVSRDWCSKFCMYISLTSTFLSLVYFNLQGSQQKLTLILLACKKNQFLLLFIEYAANWYNLVHFLQYLTSDLCIFFLN